MFFYINAFIFIKWIQMNENNVLSFSHHLHLSFPLFYAKRPLLKVVENLNKKICFECEILAMCGL